MDDFRTIVKTFEMLDQPDKQKASFNACMGLVKTQTDAQFLGKVQDFIDDHLLPARFENAGTRLGQKQESLQRSLEQILAKKRRDVALDDAVTIPIDPRLSGEVVKAEQGVPDAFRVQGSPAMSASQSTPTPLLTPASTFSQTVGTASTPPTIYPSPTTAMAPSQLEQIYAWGGSSAQHKTAEETSNEQMCKDMAERYGGVWTAPQWQGKGGPVKGYGDQT